MKRLFLSAGIAYAASVAMATASPLRAGTADMTAVTYGAVGTFSLFGTGGSFTGAGHTLSSMPCVGYGCTGITPVRVNAGLSSEEFDLSGTVSFGGNSTSYLERPGLGGGGGLHLEYTLPAFSTIGDPVFVTLTTPFTGDAGFLDPRFNGGQQLIMNGEGIATITLSLISPGFPDGSPARYRFQSAHYEFGPEPGTAALMLIGLVGWSAVTFARRDIRGS
jgi:hypothetical protein